MLKIGSSAADDDTQCCHVEGLGISSLRRIQTSFFFLTPLHHRASIFPSSTMLVNIPA
jgi:hypothetical protein